MVSMCSIPLCKGVASKQLNVKLHKFATSEKLRHIWLHRIKSYYPNFKISKSSLVCSKHFAKIDFVKNVRSQTFSLRKDAVPSLFDVDKCVYDFNDSELGSGTNRPSPSTVEVIEVTPTEINDSSNISGPSNVDIIESTQSLNIQVPVTPKTMTNATNNTIKRKTFRFSDFKVDDLNNPRKRKQYWDISQQTVKKYKCKIKMLRNKNAWLTQKLQHLCEMVEILKKEKAISENYFCS